MFIRKVVGDLVDIVLLLQQPDGLQEIGLSHLVNTNAATPGPIHNIVDTRDDGVHVARVKLEGVLEKEQTRMAIDDVLNHRYEVFRQQAVAFALAQNVDELGCLVEVVGN